MLVGVVVHPTRTQAAETAEMVSRICAEHGAASQALNVWQDEQSPADVLAGMEQRPQLVVTIGGDGTSCADWPSPSRPTHRFSA
ncbi:hypothetical protein NKG94_16135 [Micromonospora sp. M12]